MVRKIFCDVCGRELTSSEVVQLFNRDLCASCCKELVPANGAMPYKMETQRALSCRSLYQ